MQSPSLIPTASKLLALVGILAGLLLFAGVGTASADFEAPVILPPSAAGGNVSPSPNCISVNWAHSGSGVVRFSVERENPAWGEDRIGADQRSLFVCGMEPNTTYSFEVCAYFGTEDGDSECSGWVELRTGAPETPSGQQRPPAPFIVSHEAGETWVRVCWLAGYDYASYFVNHHEKGAPLTTVQTIDHENGGPQGCQRVDGLLPGRTYVLAVQGCNETFFGIGSDSCYDWSAGYEVSTLRFADAIELDAPVITTTESGETWILITWNTTPTTIRHNYDHFNIKYSVKPADGAPPTPPTTETADGAQFNHTAYNLQPGTTYVFSVQGCDLNLGLNGPPSVDCGSWSPEHEATTKAPLLTGGGTLVPALLSLSAPTVTAGNTVTVTGQAFSASGTVTLTLSGSTGAAQLGTATIDQGGFSTTVTIPATTSPGSYKVHADATGAQADASLEVIAPGGAGTLTVTASPDNGLTYTGITLDYPFTLNGANFTPGPVTIFVDSPTGLQVGTATVGGDGSFRQDFTISSDNVSTGEHKLVAVQNGTVQAEITLTFGLQDVVR